VQIGVSDVLPDTRPRESLGVEEGDATVTEIVRREGRDPRRSASARDRCPEALLPEAVEDATLSDSIVPWAESDYRGEDVRGGSDPSRGPLLLVRGADPPASAKLVHVSPRQLDFRDLRNV